MSSTAVATVLGVARPAELAERLSGPPCLLLVDAVERSPGAVAEALNRLADMAPNLRVLATGRHPVGAPGERVYPVAPLVVPPADTEIDLDVVAAYPAAALFLERLRLVRREPLDAGEVGALVDARPPARRSAARDRASPPPVGASSTSPRSSTGTATGCSTWSARSRAGCRTRR